MKYLSVCSGIEAASVAWRELGWEAVGFSEIEPFCCELLKKRFPSVPNLGSILEIKNDGKIGWFDLLVGGTPCQGFSVAGERRGLNDPRSALALVFTRLVADFKPRWFVWENVPGVLSTAGGADFKAFVDSLLSLGYGLSWRVLDAQFFGVPQRRRRIFLVGYSGDWRPAAAVLFDGAGMPGDPGAHAQARQEDPATAQSGARLQHQSGRGGLNRAEVFDIAHEYRGIRGFKEKSPTLCSRMGTGGQPVPLVLDTNFALNARIEKNITPVLTHNLYRNPMVVLDCNNCGTSLNQSPSLIASMSHWPFAATGDSKKEQEVFNISARFSLGNEISPTLTTHCAVQPYVTKQNNRLRKLSPLECERLMGFPDGWTDIPYNGRKTPAAAHRYKALGNSMAVPVMRWIGERIELCEECIKKCGFTAGKEAF